MIDVDDYLRAVGIPRPLRQGGQELILGEIVGALAGCERIALPFISSGTLATTLVRCGHEVFADALMVDTAPFLDWPPFIDGLYFGTPTIVGDRALFGEAGWTKARERQIVRELVARAADHGATRIVSGLGSGDISVAERLADMGGGFIVAHKRFAQFNDWVLVREIE